MTWSIDLDSGRKLHLLNFVYVGHSLHAPLGVDHVVKVTDFVEFCHLNSGQLAFGNKAVSREGDAITISHGEVNVAQDCV